MDIIEYGGSQIIDPRQLEAMQILENEKVPETAKQSHAGKGGRKFTYISHVWVNRMLNKAFGPLWSFRVLDWQIFNEEIKIKGNLIPSRTVAARGELILHYYIKSRQQGDPMYHQKVITEIGYFEPNSSMPAGAAVASAGSRSLVKAFTRATGVGLEFYEGEEMTGFSLTLGNIWANFKAYHKRHGTGDWKEFEKKFVERLKAEGIGKENITQEEKYYDAYAILWTMCNDTEDIEVNL